MTNPALSKINFSDGGPLFTTIPELAAWLSTAKVRAAFLVVQDADDDSKVRVMATNNDARFQDKLAFALMAYLEAFFDAETPEPVTRADRRRSMRRR